MCAQGLCYCEVKLLNTFFFFNVVLLLLFVLIVLYCTVCKEGPIIIIIMKDQICMCVVTEERLED